VTAGRAPSFRYLAVGETAALRSRECGGGQDSPADKSLKRPAQEARNGRKALLPLESGAEDASNLSP